MGIQNALRMQKVYHVSGGLWAESERMADERRVEGGSAGRLAPPSEAA